MHKVLVRQTQSLTTHGVRALRVTLPARVHKYWVIPLPWCASALMTRAEEKTLRQAEEGSLRHLDKELQLGMKAFIIELVNTGYGFVLRKVFLKQMEALLHKHKARLCIDEIMTEGRTSDRFLLIR